MTEEGYIKFECERIDSEINIPEALFNEMNACRKDLLECKWIGCLENGIGYGNISHRDPDLRSLFFISGSATGGIQNLESRHYSQVTDIDIENNSLKCKGLIDASSESLSHAAIYLQLPKVNSVIHIHDHILWTKLLNTVPTTPPGAEYGTPELALAIGKIVSNSEKQHCGIIVLAGHEDGIIAYGRNCAEALGCLVEKRDLL